jgi:hypothetical protein
MWARTYWNDSMYSIYQNLYYVFSGLAGLGWLLTVALFFGLGAEYVEKLNEAGRKLKEKKNATQV